MSDNIHSTTTEDVELWVGLSLTAGLGSQGFRALLSQVGTPDQIYGAKLADLGKVVSEKVARKINAGPDSEAAAPALEWLQQPGNHLLTLANTHYPQTLLEIQPPLSCPLCERTS